MYRPRVGQQFDYSYNQPIPGYAFVREDRPITLQPGKTTIRITDVAALIEPTTVSFKSMTDPEGTRVGEQNFQFDLVTNQKLLEKFIDKPISLDVTRGNQASIIHGTLLSASGGLILKKADGLLIVEVGEAERALRRLLPNLPMQWIPFSVGAMGVFALEASALRAEHAAVLAVCKRRNLTTKVL